MVESRHRGAVAVLDVRGGVVFSAGDIDRPVFPRSAIKALLALPLVESGAADAVGLTAMELALACASHHGEPPHLAAAAAMLGKAGRDVSALECGVQHPGRAPTPLANNCSGKHAGFVCLACHLGDDPAGYVRPDHPAMRVATAALADLTGARLDASNRAVDGCSIPTYAIPLRALARAFARFATGHGMDASRAAAAARLRDAVLAHPFMVGGTESFDTALMRACGAAVFSKGGAEGVHCCALPTLGLGVAVKCSDGAARASDVVTAAIVAKLLPSLAGQVGALGRRVLHNWNGIAVGELRPAEILA